MLSMATEDRVGLLLVLRAVRVRVWVVEGLEDSCLMEWLGVHIVLVIVLVVLGLLLIAIDG